MHNLKINGHGHILPEPSEIPKFMKEKKLFWIDDDKKFMRQDDWSRPITDPSFFFNEKLEWMDRYKIDHGVMLNLSQVYCNGWSRPMMRSVGKMISIIVFSNEDLTSLRADLWCSPCTLKMPSKRWIVV